MPTPTKARQLTIKHCDDCPHCTYYYEHDDDVQLFDSYVCDKQVKILANGDQFAPLPIPEWCDLPVITEHKNI